MRCANTTILLRLVILFVVLASIANIIFGMTTKYYEDYLFMMMSTTTTNNNMKEEIIMMVNSSSRVIEEIQQQHTTITIHHSEEEVESSPQEPSIMLFQKPKKRQQDEDQQPLWEMERKKIHRCQNNDNGTTISQNHNHHHNNNNNIGLTTMTTTMTTLPTILLPGAQKCGTSTLAFWLKWRNSKNEGVCRAKVMEGEPKWYEKEVQFFNNPKRYEQCQGFYEKRFKHCLINNTTTTHNNNNNNKTVTRNRKGIVLSLDATPAYFLYPERIFDMYNRSGQVETLKIILTLREPISREISMYNHMNVLDDPLLKKFLPHNNNRTFEEFARKITIPVVRGEKDRNVLVSHKGLYSRYLKIWFRLFSREQILVLSYDEIKYNPSMTRMRVEQFLDQDFPVHNKSWAHVNALKHPTKINLCPCSIQKELENIYRPYNEELYDLLATTEGRPPMEQHPFPKFQIGNCTPEEI